MCERSRKASITRMKMRGYTSKQNQSSGGMDPRIKSKNGWMGAEQRESANGQINTVMANGTHSSAQHSAAVPFVGDAGQVRCKVKLDRTRMGGTQAHQFLHPRVLSEPDGIETLPAPSPPLFQYLHVVQLYQLLRWGRRPLHPTLPALPCCGTLLALSWRSQFRIKDE